MAQNRLTAGLRAVHPGEVLREDVIPALGLSISSIARHLGVSRQTLHEILAARRPVTAQMALRIGKLCGNGPDIWLRLQNSYDLREAEKTIGPALRNIPTLSAVV